jgi:serine O-acetyltransferase
MYRTPMEPNRFRDLEAAIDAVVASYTGQLTIDNLESSALPNKRAVIEAFDHLKSAVFVGFYAKRAIRPENLRHEIAEHLYAAHHLFSEQIDRALTYDRWMNREIDPTSARAGADTNAIARAHEPSLLPEGSGEAVALALFAQIPALRREIDLDVRAAYDGDPAAKNVEEIVYSYPSIEAIVAYRIAHRLLQSGLPMIPRIITEHAHSRTGIDISPGAQIGERFFIDHGTGVVIGETSVIGNDVKLYQGVTLGALSVPRRHDSQKRHPTLEDGVTIYAGATVLGGDTIIGARSVIGGNVWLTKSVPPDSKVFGRSRDE